MTPQHGDTDGRTVLVSMSILSASLGTVHAFSVFLVPLESTLGVGRAESSFTYSLALVCLTLAVLLGHRLYPLLHPAGLVAGIAGAAAFGAYVSASAESIGWVWLGYGVIFGAANGLGYGYGLQFSAQANPGREGQSMGIVTAAYALGAAIAPVLFSKALDTGGLDLALRVFALGLSAAGGLSAMLLVLSPVRYATAERAANAHASMNSLAGMWLAYGTAVAAGLMIIGHAAALAGTRAMPGTAWLTPGVVAMCNLGGSLLAGQLADRWPHRRLLVALPLVSAIALLAGAASSGLLVLLPLGVIGFAYGGIIAVYPAMIAHRYGSANSARAYGRVFTAWGTAGLVAPWFAGALFDLWGTYTAALVVAAGLSLASSLCARRFL